MRIEEAAAQKQARIDSGADPILGVNVYKVEDEADIDVLQVDNTAVRAQQIASINRIKSNRFNERVNKALEDLTRAASDPSQNLLEHAVIAARERATLGEISDAMEEVFGRYKATIRTIQGVYQREIAMDDHFKKACDLADVFAAKVGRRPRIMIGGAKVIATSFADIGFDVDIGPLFQTPEEAAHQAAINDVHILGISSLAAGHKTLVPQTIAALKEIGRGDILVIAGGVIPPQDYQELFDSGVAGVFGPGTVIAQAACEILDIMIDYFHR